MSSSKLSVPSVWALAAGGMVGGGIYTVLGVVIAAAGQWTWLGFLLTGIIALASAYSYASLSNKFNESGGAFGFLEELDDKNIGGNIAWLLILGYIFTISVYCYAFGHYLSFAFHGTPMLTRGLAIGITIGLIMLNLSGVGKMTKVEITIVSVNLLILLGLGIYGLTQWDSHQLTSGIAPKPAWASLIGGAAIFMAYEGFQLLTYEYDKIKNPEKIFVPTLVSAVGCVIFIYIIVSVGATMLGGAYDLVSFKQVALSVAAKKTFGQTGLWVMTIAAGFATTAAINSTLFSTASLSRSIANRKELPQWFSHTNSNDVPDRAVILIGSLAGILAVIGSLSALVEAASVVFLITFGTVNLLAYRNLEKRRWIPVTGIAFTLLIGLALIGRLIITKPIALTGLVVVSLLIILGRPYLLKITGTKDDQD
ncbi:APC family permease [Roseivirga sp. BDSF3-8]|uniref:APC family permease n=1 Tax=Roseivirga sp. BDSF3-8 TaxID=3241598 RepID=UPI0035321040